MNEAAASVNEHSTDDSPSSALTKAQVIGWLAANLTNEVRGRERREAALARAVAIVGRLVEAVGDDARGLMPDFILDMYIGRSWELEHPVLNAEVRAHITLMERQSGRRPTFSVNGKSVSRKRTIGTRRGR